MISVAMATYNGELYIEEQIMSILNQSVPVDEIIIYDDCSTDRTVEIIKKINCSKIKINVNEQTFGYIENFYQAISHTKGDYIFLADQDDVWENTKVEESLQVITQGNTSAVCTNFMLIDSEGKEIADRKMFQMNTFLYKNLKEIEEISLFRLAFGNIVQGCTYCVKKSVRDAYVNIHNKEVIHDYQIMLIAACIGKVKFYNKSLIRYRLHGNNAIGFSKKNRHVNIPSRIAKEPFMARFFRQMNCEVSVPYKSFYVLLYYLRIPFLVAILKKKIFAK